MKRSAAVLLLILIWAVEGRCQSLRKPHGFLRKVAASGTSTAKMNVNRISMDLDNVGGLSGDEPLSTWDGWNQVVWYAYSEDMVYDHTLWIVGKRGSAIGALASSWYSPYSPGPVIGGLPALKVRPQDAERYRVYTVTRGDSTGTNPDYAQWPADLGAPSTPSGAPRISGDQMAWMVYNGDDTTAFPSWFHLRLPQRTQLPVEIRETVFEHFGEPTDTSIWANCLFFEWAVYNKGPDPIDSMFLSIWTDIDFIDDFRTFPAVDTLAQAGYCWYGTDSSAGCTSYILLDGPCVPSPGDTATYFGKPRPGWRNLPLTSFWGVADDSYPDSSTLGPPYSDGTAWNVVRGLTQRGLPIIDSTTHQPTKFPWSGDPITHTGSLWPLTWTGGGGGFIMTTGCFTLAPGDSQWVMAAIVPTAQSNGIDAINRMRMDSRYLRSLPYDSLVSHKARRSIAVKPLPEFAVPTSFVLHQNYPNPFNNGTIISFDLPDPSMVTVEIFDILGRSVASLAEQEFEQGTQSVSWYTMSCSGTYLIRVKATSLASGKSWSGVRKALVLK